MVRSIYLGLTHLNRQGATPALAGGVREFAKEIAKTAPRNLGVIERILAFSVAWRLEKMQLHNFYNYNNIPNKIKMDAPVKMTGHNLNVMKLTFTPVNNDTTDSTFSPMTASQ